jgi:hypothetical protein
VLALPDARVKAVKAERTAKPRQPPSKVKPAKVRLAKERAAKERAAKTSVHSA